jgi:hypothetical protein
MNYYRKLVIKTPSLNNQLYVDSMNEYMRNKQRFDEKRIKLFYKFGSSFRIYLYGLDGSLKHKYNYMNANKIIGDINAMPMGSY